MLQTHWSRLSKRFPKAVAVGELYRLDRPIGTFLLLWPTLWALWLAGNGHPSAANVWIFLGGVILMRAAGCAINDFADREIDPYVQRTQNRPLAQGRLQPRDAIRAFLAAALGAFVLVLFTNPLTIGLSFAGLLLAALYPFAKRFTYWPQLVLGSAFAWAVPMAFAAQIGQLPPLAWLLFLATVLWTTAYDTQYAMMDRKFDLKIGVKSTAILFGDADRLIIGIIQAVFLLAMLLIGQRAALQWPYYAGLLLALLLFCYQHYLTWWQDPDDSLRAFLNNNWVGMVIFVGLLGSYHV